jgi:hypothetical protein
MQSFCVWKLKVLPNNKTVDPKFPGTGLSDIKKSFEKIAMTFLARTKIKGMQCFHVIEHSKGYPLTKCMSKIFVCSAHSEGAGVAHAFVMLTPYIFFKL